VTAHEYVVGVRVAEAQKLLANRNTMVADAAYAVGYLKPGAFTAAFKKHTGMLPKSYRMLIARENARPVISS
jgi:AraC family transcriptional regulator